MDQPTREQFEEAARRVIKTAPSGLSKQQFFDLIDQELAKGAPIQQTTLAGMMRAGPSPEEEHEPDTWIGGFLKGLKKEFSLEPMRQSIQHPRTAGELLPYVLPDTPLALSAVREFPERAATALKAANRPGILSKVGLPVRAIGEFNRRLGEPLESTKAAMRNVPNVGGTPDRGIPFEEPILAESPPGTVDRYMPNRSGVRDVSDEILNRLNREVTGNRPTYYPSGTQTELPRSPLADVDRYMPNTSGIPDRGVPTGELPMSSLSEVDRYAPNQGADWSAPEAGGVTPPPPDINEPMTVPEMRRMYGSREASQMSGVPSSEIKELGPSQTPLSVEMKGLDTDYRRALDDPLMSLLISALGGGAVAATRRQ